MALIDFFSDKKSLRQAVIFMVLVIIGLIIWLVFENFLSPPIIAVNQNYTNLGKNIDPEIDLQSLTIMEQKRNIDITELEKFPIYVLREKVNQNDNVLEVSPSQIAEPFDLAYFSLMQKQLATPSADISADITDINNISN